MEGLLKTNQFRVSRPAHHISALGGVYHTACKVSWAIGPGRRICVFSSLFMTKILSQKRKKIITDILVV